MADFRRPRPSWHSPPGQTGSGHQLYLMCDNIHRSLDELAARGVTATQEVTDQGWGLLSAIGLPDGTELPSPARIRPRPVGQ